MNADNERSWDDAESEWDDDDDDCLEPTSLDEEPFAGDSLDFEFDEEEPEPEACDFRVEIDDDRD